MSWWLAMVRKGRERMAEEKAHVLSEQTARWDPDLAVSLEAAGRAAEREGVVVEAYG